MSAGRHALNSFISAMEQLLPNKTRLQDMSKLQIVSKCSRFTEYLRASPSILFNDAVICIRDSQ